MILLIDNYDSFTYNLAHMFGELGAEVVVRRNDEIDADEADRLRPTHLVVSPGPGRPPAAGETLAILRRLTPRTPTLGVCLGHQAIVEAFGGEVGHARQLVHGKATMVRNDGLGLFRGLPVEFEAGRYHSLAATTIPDELDVAATAPGRSISRRLPHSSPRPPARVSRSTATGRSRHRPARPTSSKRSGSISSSRRT